MKRSVAVVCGLAVLGIAPVADADELLSSRAQQLAEVSHNVELSIDRGVAKYVVRRTFSNRGVRTDQASVRIDMAHGAAATGLRIRARDRWYAGELMERDLARERYEELTGIGDFEPKDPALLEWAWADALALYVFPVMSGGVSTVEYTLTAPLKYRNGRYVVSYPRLTQRDPDEPDALALAEPVLTISPGYGNAGTKIVVAGVRVAPGAGVVLGPEPPLRWVGEGYAEEGSGYVFNAMDVAKKTKVSKATVHAEIDHTYASDLEVELVRPDGVHLSVTRGESSENDIRGDFEVDLDGPVSAKGKWTLMVADNAGLDVGTLDAWSIKFEPEGDGKAWTETATNLPAFIPDASDSRGDGGHAIIEIEPPRIKKMAARLGRVVASEAHGFSRLELDAAPRMSKLPKKASVVFAVDVSRSHAEYEVDDQLRIADAYLAHVPDASVEVVVFDRKARRLFGEFVPATEFAKRVEKARAKGGLERGNGSAFELGLGAAKKALDGRSGPARVVSMTDAMLRTRFRNAMGVRAFAGASKRSVMHIVVPLAEHHSSLERADDHALSTIASRYGGVLFRVTVPEEDKRVRQVAAVLPLVRPVSIDHLRVTGLDLADAPELPDQFREGIGYRAMLPMAKPPARVVVTGKIWAKSFRRVVKNGPHFDAATAAFVFSEDEYGDLSEEEMLKVAFMGRAVSPVTSYLAIEPGVRPSVDGFVAESFGVGGLGLIGRGGGGGGGRTSPPRLRTVLAAAGKRCAKRLSAPVDWKVELDVETTSAEIVDVQALSSTDKTLEDCVVEEVWATHLPDASWPERKSHKVTLSS